MAYSVKPPEYLLSNTKWYPERLNTTRGISNVYFLNPLVVSSPGQDHGAEKYHAADDPKERRQVVVSDIHERDRHVHSENTADQVERHQN